MSDVEVHLYVIMWPNYALVGSNLPPEEFGKHYTLGSSRYFHGQVVFAEIDSSYRHEFLKIDKYIPEVKPNAAGRPKRTKFMALELLRLWSSGNCSRLTTWIVISIPTLRIASLLCGLGSVSQQKACTWMQCGLRLLLKIDQTSGARAAITARYGR